MNIGNITTDNFNLDSNGKDMQIEVYEQLIEQLQQENKQLKEKYINAVADYETTMSENNQLKDNWNKLKEKVNEGMRVYRNRGYDLAFDIEEIPKEELNDFISYLAFQVMEQLIINMEQGSGKMKYRLKDDVSFSELNKSSIMKFDFDLSNYYNKETRIFEFPKDYVAFSLMSDVFNSFLFPLDLVEEIKKC